MQGQGLQASGGWQTCSNEYFRPAHRRPAPRPTYTQTTHHWVSSIFYRKIVAVGRKRMYWCHTPKKGHCRQTNSRTNCNVLQIQSWTVQLAVKYFSLAGLCQTLNSFPVTKSGCYFSFTFYVCSYFVFCSMCRLQRIFWRIPFYTFVCIWLDPKSDVKYWK